LKREEAELICRELLIGEGQLVQHFKKYLACGSIRRLKETVKDIDIVAIPKDDSEYQFGEIGLPEKINLLDPMGKTAGQGVARFSNGSAIKRFEYKGISIDLYLADESTFETLVLIRTGSTEHNIRLTQIARSKGLKLFASGKGLCKIKGGIYNNEPEEIIEIVQNTEDGILNYLLGRIPKPEERRN
jgi:DNA polymerase/3'-5' exonuclease PolX